MSWPQQAARVTGRLVGTFGEPVTLPSGEVTGVFDARWVPREARETGRSLRFSQQPAPVLWLRDEDAAGLAERDRITARGGAYLVTRIDPDGPGITEVALMPVQAETVDALQRWR